MCKEHKFIEVLRYFTDIPFLVGIVKWCEQCGAIRVDREGIHGLSSSCKKEGAVYPLRLPNNTEIQQDASEEETMDLEFMAKE